MKIAIFANAYKPIISGVVNCIDLMRINLEKKGHEVFIFAPYFQGYEDKDDEFVIRYPSLNLTNKVKFPVPLPFCPKAEKFLSENKMDIVHCHHPFLLGEEGVKWAARYNAPLFFTFHTQYEMYAHYIPLPQDFVKNVSKNLVAAFSKKCSKIITPGTAIVELLKGYGVGDNVVYMQNSINLDSFKNPDKTAVRKQYGIKDEEKLLVYVGRMAQEKNIPFMIDAFKKISAKCPSKLMIIGEGPELENFMEYAEVNNMMENIIFTGRVEYKDIPLYYGSADLFVMTSTTEVKPLALLEASASGLPIVAVSACGASDTIEDGVNGFLTQENRDAFAEKVLYALSDRERLERMSGESVKIANSYSAENVVNRLLDLYREAIENIEKVAV